MATVDLTVAADLSALRRELAEIPGIGADAAAKMASELNKSIRAAEKASKTAAKATKDAATQAAAAAKKAAEANAEVGDRIGKVGEASAKLRGSLSLLGGPLGEAAGLINDLADAGEVAASVTPKLVPVLGAVAAAALPLIGHFAVLSREQEEAAARSAFLAEHMHDLDAATRAYEDAVLAAAVATGQLTEEQARLQAIQDAASRSVEDFRASQEDQRREAEASFFANQKWLGRLEVLPDFLSTAVDYYAGFSSAQAEARHQLEQLDGIEVQHQETVAATAVAQERATVATRNRTQADTAATDALKALEEQEARVLAQNAAYLVSLRDLQSIARDATEAQLTGADAVEAALARRVEQVNETAAKQVEASAGNAGQLLLIEQARADAVVALEAEAQSKIDAINEEALQKRLAEIEQEQAAREESARAAVSATAGLFGSIGDLAGAAGEAQVGASKEAALALFEIQKAAALAQAAINTALAVSQALVAGAGTPVGAILAASALASGVAQAATIASTPPPSFSDTPGVMQMGNRGAVSLAAGDYFAAAKDPQELQRQTGGGGSASILEVRLGHRVLDRSVAQVLRQGGRLSREINSTRTGSPSHAVRS